MEGIEMTGTAEEGNPHPTTAEGDGVTDRPPDHPPGAVGGEGHEGVKEEEKDGTVVLQEGRTAKDKPPAELLARIREKNKKGLLQDYSLLGPGSRVYLKWPDRFRKKVPAPYDTPWVELLLVKECAVSKGTRKICLQLTAAGHPHLSL